MVETSGLFVTADWRLENHLLIVLWLILKEVDKRKGYWSSSTFY